MPATLLMRARRQFGAANRARLNRELVDAVIASAASRETCGDIKADLETDAEGGDFVEATSFPGSTIDRLNAHFRFHWKDDYEQA